MIKGKNLNWEEFLLTSVLESDDWEVSAEAPNGRWLGDLSCTRRERTSALLMCEPDRLSLLQGLYEQVKGKRSVEFSDIPDFKVGDWFCRVQRLRENRYKVLVFDRGKAEPATERIRKSLKTAIELVQVEVAQQKQSQAFQQADLARRFKELQEDK